MKKSCVEIRNIKGNISNIKVGELRSDKYIGKKLLTLISLKKSNSLNRLSMKIKLNIINKT